MRSLAPLLPLLLGVCAVAGPISFDKQTLTKDFVAEGCACLLYTSDAADE